MLVGLLLVLCAAAILYFALSVRAALRNSAEEAARLRASYREWSDRLEAAADAGAEDEGDDPPSAHPPPS